MEFISGPLGLVRFCLSSLRSVYAYRWGPRTSGTFMTEFQKFPVKDFSPDYCRWVKGEWIGYTVIRTVRTMHNFLISFMYNHFLINNNKV